MFQLTKELGKRKEVFYTFSFEKESLKAGGKARRRVAPEKTGGVEGRKPGKNSG